MRKSLTSHRDTDGTVLHTFQPELTDLQRQVLDLPDIPTPRMPLRALREVRKPRFRALPVLVHDVRHSREVADQLKQLAIAQPEIDDQWPETWLANRRRPAGSRLR